MAINTSITTIVETYEEEPEDIFTVYPIAEVRADGTFVTAVVDRVHYEFNADSPAAQSFIHAADGSIVPASADHWYWNEE